MADVEIDNEPETGTLNPRQRKLCELAAVGKTNNEIAKELNYSASRVSILMSQANVKETILRLQNMLFEETVVKRLKSLGDPAISNIEDCILDKQNRYKPELKIELSKWVVEKLDGKPAQKVDIGGNLLGAFLDKMDSLKAAGKTLNDVIDITPSAEKGEFLELNPAEPVKKATPLPESEEYLHDFVEKMS